MYGKLTRRSILRFSGGLVGVAGIAGITSGQSEATVIVDRDDPDAYDDIQTAIDVASPGATVRVTSGTYTGSILVWKPLTLVGDSGDDSPGAGPNAPVLDGQGETETSAIFPYNPERDESVDGITIRGFVIQNYGKSPAPGEWGNGIRGGQGSNNITVADSTFRDMGANGIGVFSPGSFTHDGWVVERNRFEGCGADCIHIDSANDLLVRDNLLIGGSQNGGSDIAISLPVTVRDGSSTEVSGIEVSGNRMEGPFGNAGLFLLPINKNPSDRPTKATMSDVYVHDNVAQNLGGAGEDPTKAFRMAANAYGTGNIERITEGPARVNIRNVRYENNVAENGEVGFTADTNGRDAITDITYVDNVARDNTDGFVVAGRAEGAIRGVTFEDNTVVGNESVGFWIRTGDGDETQTYTDAITEVTVRGTNVVGNTYGVLISGEGRDEIGSLTFEKNHVKKNAQYGVLTFGGVNLEEVQFHRNDIYENGGQSEDGVGVGHSADGMLSMTCTFWGHPTGPSTEEKSKGQGERVVGDVTTQPWLPQSFTRVPPQACRGGKGNGEPSPNSQSE